MSAIALVLGSLLSLYFWIVIIAAVLTWVRPDPYNPIVRTLRTLTEPVFYRVRKWLPFTYSSGMKQLHKIVSVIKVVDFADIPAVAREMIFVKVQAEGPMPAPWRRATLMKNLKQQGAMKWRPCNRP